MSTAVPARFNDLVTDLVTDVLAQLGEGRPLWTVGPLAWDPLSPPPPPNWADMDFVLRSLDGDELDDLVESGANLEVTLLDPRGRPVATAMFPVAAGFARAAAEVASQIQDHAIESREGWGRPLPVCPLRGVHPMTPEDAQ